MAEQTGSQAAGRQRMQEAGYRTGASSAQSQPRCDKCAHMQQLPDWVRQTTHDRYCTKHLARCKTHGCCTLHTSIEVAT